MSYVAQAGFEIAAPSTGPTVAAGTASGSMDASAAYGYKVTFVTNYGESLPGPAGSGTSSASGSVNLTAIPLASDGNIISRKLYRTQGGGATYNLLTTFNDNTTTTYTDTVADGSLTTAIPTVNSANSLEIINGWQKNNLPSVRSVERGITAGAGGTSAAAYQLTKEFSIVAVSASANDSVKLPGLNASLIGMHVRIKNNGANTIRIYPFDGQTINGGAADAPITAATTVATELIADQAANWSVVS